MVSTWSPHVCLVCLTKMCMTEYWQSHGQVNCVTTFRVHDSGVYNYWRLDIHWCVFDCLCGLVVRVLGYRSGGPGSIPGTTKKKVVGLKRGPLSLVSTTEELLDRKVAAPVQKTENTAVGTRHADHVAPFIRRSWQLLRREAAVARSV
jgi:hypothetical protein